MDQKPEAAVKGTVQAGQVTQNVGTQSDTLRLTPSPQPGTAGPHVCAVPATKGKIIRCSFGSFQ